LILCSTQSPRPSRAITRLLADALPRARHRTIRRGNHMSAITDPAAVNPVILEHLLINSAYDDKGAPLRANGGEPSTTLPLVESVSISDESCASLSPASPERLAISA